MGPSDLLWTKEEVSVYRVWAPITGPEGMTLAGWGRRGRRQWLLPPIQGTQLSNSHPSSLADLALGITGECLLFLFIALLKTLTA